MFERTLDQSGVQRREIERGGSTKLQVGLHLELMIRLGSPPPRIQGKHTWINLQLLGHERDNLVWGRLQVVRHKAEISEDTELEGIAQAILGVPLSLGFLSILIRQQEKDKEIVLGHAVGQALPAFPLGLGEKVNRHTTLLLGNDPILLANPERSLHCTIFRYLID